MGELDAQGFKLLQQARQVHAPRCGKHVFVVKKRPLDAEDKACNLLAHIVHLCCLGLFFVRRQGFIGVHQLDELVAARGVIGDGFQRKGCAQQHFVHHAFFIGINLLVVQRGDLFRFRQAASQCRVFYLAIDFADDYPDVLALGGLRGVRGAAFFPFRAQSRQPVPGGKYGAQTDAKAQVVPALGPAVYVIAGFNPPARVQAVFRKGPPTAPLDHKASLVAHQAACRHQMKGGLDHFCAVPQHIVKYQRVGLA